MLILTRRAPVGDRRSATDSEGIQIGPNIRVYLLDRHGDQVRVGIEAPPDIHIRRTELPKRCTCERGTCELHPAAGATNPCHD